MKKIWPELLIGLIEIALLVAQNLDLVRRFFSEDPSIATVRILTLQFGLFLLYVVVRLGLIKAADDSFHEELRKDIRFFEGSNNKIRPLHEDQFYAHLGDRIEKADKSVSLTHLDIRPPKKLHGSTSEAYYDNFFKQVKARETIRFQRLERISKDKIEWIEAIIGNLENRPNFSLRALSTPNNRPITGLISVQLIDDTYTFLVAITGHYVAHTNRDVVIEGKEITSMWRKYYDDVLWEHAAPIISDGVLDQASWEKLKNHLNKGEAG